MNYENENIGNDLQEKDVRIKCKNYQLCEAILPTWWFECKNNYLCTTCHLMFGTWGTPPIGNTGKGALDFVDNIECPVCFENKQGVSHPNCDHFICIDCFKRCYYGDETGEPEFPYPELEDEYYDDRENPKWETEYPLIRLYEEEWDNWENAKHEKYSKERNLRMCPLCRK